MRCSKVTYVQNTCLTNTAPHYKAVVIQFSLKVPTQLKSIYFSQYEARQVHEKCNDHYIVEENTEHVGEWVRVGKYSLV